MDVQTSMHAFHGGGQADRFACMCVNMCVKNVSVCLHLSIDTEKMWSVCTLHTQQKKQGYFSPVQRYPYSKCIMVERLGDYDAVAISLQKIPLLDFLGQGNLFLERNRYLTGCIDLMICFDLFSLFLSLCLSVSSHLDVVHGGGACRPNYESVRKGVRACCACARVSGLQCMV